MFKKFFAKLVGLEGWPKSQPKAETGQEKFNSTEADAKRFAEANKQANLRRIAERNQGEKDVTEEMEKFANENNRS